MAKGKKLKVLEQELSSLQDDSQLLQDNYIAQLDTNPKYSLLVDPENRYNMTDQQKSFIEYYVNFKSVSTAAQMARLTQQEATQYFVAFSTQQEIRRLNLAMYHRQFANRLLNLDEIGGYLTSLLTGNNVALADQPKNIGERLQIVKLLIDINKLKIEGLQNPDVIMVQDVDAQIKDLSLATVKSLLAQSNKPKEAIDVPIEGMGIEESAYLSTLNTSELLKLIEESNGEVNGDDVE